MISTMFIAVPSAIKTFNWLGTLWGGNIRFTDADAERARLRGDVRHRRALGHLHGLHAGRRLHPRHLLHRRRTSTTCSSAARSSASSRASTSGIPKMFGRMMNETLGKIHFGLTFIFFNLHRSSRCTSSAWAGMPRRIADYTQYALLKHLQPMNQFMTIAVFVLGAAQLILVFNFFLSMRRGKVAGQNPWHANTLEWRRPRRRRTGTSRAASRRSTAAPTSTAFRATPPISGRRPRSRRGPRRRRMADSLPPPRAPAALRALTARCVVGGGDAPPHRRGRPRHLDGVGALGARLADDLRPQHVHVPALEDGRRDPVRAHPPADRLDRRSS